MEVSCVSIGDPVGGLYVSLQVLYSRPYDTRTFLQSDGDADTKIGIQTGSVKSAATEEVTLSPGQFLV